MGVCVCVHIRVLVEDGVRPEVQLVPQSKNLSHVLHRSTFRLLDDKKVTSLSHYILWQCPQLGFQTSHRLAKGLGMGVGRMDSTPVVDGSRSWVFSVEHLQIGHLGLRAQSARKSCRRKQNQGKWVSPGFATGFTASRASILRLLWRACDTATISDAPPPGRSIIASACRSNPLCTRKFLV